VRRLEAMEHVANGMQGNPYTQKTPFVLPDLAHYEDKARDLAHALHKFVMIERFVALNDWKAIRHATPEQRVLMGETLLVRYVEPDQEPGVAEQNREHQRRYQKRKEYEAALKAANPDKPFKPTKEQSAECRWSPEGLRVKLRLETAGVDSICTKRWPSPTCGTATGWCCTPAGPWTSGCRPSSARNSRRRPSRCSTATGPNWSASSPPTRTRRAARAS
jgi:hypothetical protein